MKTNLFIFAMLAIVVGGLALFARHRRIKEVDPTKALTFDEFVQYGRDNGGNIVNGMPWSFKFHGHAVSHENDRRYLVNAGGETLNFTPDDIIALDDWGDVVIYHPA